MSGQETNNQAINDGKNYIKMISDPIRSRIMIEALLRGEVTAKDLIDILDINRSAISYHLSLMVENNILSVKIDEVGRPIKRYSLRSNELLNKFDEIVNNASKQEKKELLLAKLNLYAGTMQMIANLSVDAIKQITTSDLIEAVGISKNQIVEYSFKNRKELFIPLIFKFLSQEQINELMDEFIRFTIEKIRSTPTTNTKNLLENEKLPYLVMFTCFPLHHLDKKKLHE